LKGLVSAGITNATKILESKGFNLDKTLEVLKQGATTSADINKNTVS